MRTEWRPRIAFTVAAVISAGAVAAGVGLGLLADPGTDREPGNPAASAPSAATSESVPVTPDFTASPPAGSVQALDALLLRRAQAITACDLDAFLADLDQGQDDLVAEQRMLFANLAELPVGSAEFARRDYRAPAAAGSEGRALVEARIRLDGVDPAPTVARYRWDIAIEDGRLVITDIGVNETGAENPYAPTPWDSAPLTAVRTPHALVVVTTESEDRAGDLADAVESAYQRSRDLWPADVPDRFAVFGTSRRAIFEAWYGTGGGALGTGTAGQAVPVATCCATERRTLGDITSTHVIVDLDEVGSGIELERLLAHELTHAVAQPRTVLGNRLPRWAEEGFAEFVGVQLRRSYGAGSRWPEVVRDYVRRGGFTGTLPADADFYGSDAEANYGLSVQFFEFLAQRYGPSKVSEFYFGLAAMPDPDLDVAIQADFKISENRLLADWADWVRES